MLDRGLAYQKDGFVNWDPVDQTVLANEQVDSEGRSWRSGAKVQRVRMKQWFLKITDYAERLFHDLDGLDGWPDSVKELQKGWIGLTKGHTVGFKVQDLEGNELKDITTVSCFTTKIETLEAARFVAVSPFHPILSSVWPTLSLAKKEALNELKVKVQSIKEVSLMENKTQPYSVHLGYCIHPLNQIRIPLYASDYVLEDYGTGAIMGVPSGDERDARLAAAECLVFEEGEHLGCNPQPHWGQASNGIALRDWLVSRQRYWGVPIPVIHCDNCGAVPVPEEDLPVILPEVKSSHDWTLKSSIRLLDSPNFKNCKCPKCSKPATRDIDTMDTFVDSSWYFLRFLDPTNTDRIFSSEVTNQMPVKAYIGGMEHAIKHLLYARFVHKFLKDLGLVKIPEPFENIITQGLVKGLTYKLKDTGRYLSKDEAKQYTKEQVSVEVEKMSKSKLNGISPLDAIREHGLDCLKLSMVFAGPVEKDILMDEKLITTMVGMTLNTGKLP